MLNHSWMKSTSISKTQVRSCDFVVSLMSCDLCVLLTVLLIPLQISLEMLTRKPSSVECHPNPNPSCLPYPITGGWDQATLRRSLESGYDVQYVQTHLQPSVLLEDLNL